MKHSIVIAATAMLAAFGFSPGVGGRQAGGGAPSIIAVQPGEWEMTTAIVRMRFPDLPSDATRPVPPPSTARSCVTPEQAASAFSDFAGQAENRDCTVQDDSHGSGRIRISLLCQMPPQGTMRVRIDGRHTATTLDVDQHMSVEGSNGTMQMDARITGRRIGECAARRRR